MYIRPDSKQNRIIPGVMKFLASILVAGKDFLVTALEGERVPEEALKEALSLTDALELLAMELVSFNLFCLRRKLYTLFLVIHGK